jgi:dihydrofolate reductase
MKLGLIYAQSRNGVIGKGGVMPWHLPEDLAHFKQLTLGCPVVMGRKTWDSLPPRFRPLPGRRNIVVTRQSDWHVERAERTSSLQEAIALCAGAPLVWILGGGEIFAQAEPLAHVAEVTVIDRDFEGDTFAPRLAEDWQETSRERHHSSAGFDYSFVTYTREQRGG